LTCCRTVMLSATSVLVRLRARFSTPASVNATALVLGLSRRDIHRFHSSSRPCMPSNDSTLGHGGVQATGESRGQSHFVR
jgi:hypothetical protein